MALNTSLSQSVRESGVNPPVEVNASDPDKILRSTAHQAEDLFVRCLWKGKPCNISEVVKPSFTRLGLCHTFNIDNDSAQVTQSGAGFGLSLMMNIESYEYMKGPENQVGVKVLLHNANEEPLVKDLGFAVAPGTHTLIGIKQTRVSHLPKPYGECRPDVLHTSNCMFQSRAQNIASKCHCREPFLESSVIDDVAPCNMTQTFKCVLREWFFMNQDDVRNMCPVPCQRISYEPVLSHAHLSKISMNKNYKEIISSIRDDYFHAKEVARRVDPEIASDDRGIVSHMIEKALLYTESVSRFLGYMEKKPDFTETRMFRNLLKTFTIIQNETVKRQGAHRLLLKAGWRIGLMLKDLENILGRRKRLFERVCPDTGIQQKVTMSPGSMQENSSVCNGLSERDTKKIRRLEHKIQQIRALLNNMSLYMDAKGYLFNRTGGWDDDNAYVTCLDKRLDLHGSWEENLTRAVNACAVLLWPWPFNQTSKTKAVGDLDAFFNWITSDITATSDFGVYGLKTCSQTKLKTYIQLRETYWNFNYSLNAVKECSDKMKDSYDTLHGCLMGCNQSVSKEIELFLRLLESYQEGSEVNTKDNGTFYPTLLAQDVRRISQIHKSCIKMTKEYTKILRNLRYNIRRNINIFKGIDLFPPMSKHVSKIFQIDRYSQSVKKAGRDLLYEGNKWIRNHLNRMERERRTFIDEFAKLNRFMKQMPTQFEASARVFDDRKFFTDNYIKMDIFYRSLSYEEISQQKAFEFLSLLSEIGGFLGLLLGASVLTVFELLDYLAVMALNKCKATSRFNFVGN